MKRSGFTMIELVFIIVILGILGAIAVPKMAASRNDAKAVAIKSDIGTITQALPAWVMSQGKPETLNFTTNSAVSINEGNWTKTATKLETKINDDGAAPTTDKKACVTIEIKQKGTSAAITDDPAGIESGAYYLQIITATGTNLCQRIGTAGTQNIPLAGKSVSFN